MILKNMNLIELLQKYNLNSYNTLIGTDKNTAHSYIDNFYEKAFAYYKDKNPTLLEIGTACGASLFLWKKYFINGSFYGLDIYDVLKKDYFIEDIKYLLKDAYDLNVINSLPNFDIIIDDGPHNLETQLILIKNYLNKLNKNGILVIEDIETENNLNILIDNIPNEYKMSYEVFDLRKIKNKNDDILLAIRNDK